MSKYVNKFNSMSIAVKASIVYLLASLFTKGMSIITVPVFTRMMPTTEIGVTTTFTSWSLILSAIANLSLTAGSFQVAMLEFKDNRDEYESSILSLSTVAATILLIIYLSFATFWNSIFSLPTKLMFLMMIGFVFTPALDFWMIRQRYEYKYKASATITILLSVISSVAAIICVILAKQRNIQDLGSVRLFATNIIVIIISIVFYISIFIKGKLTFNKKYWHYALKLSIPLMVHSLAKLILDVSDRAMIARMVGQSAAGVYGTLYSISSLSLIVWTAINSSLVPYMFERLGTEDERNIKTVVYPLLIMYAIYSFALTLIAPEIVRILTPREYYEAIYIMPPIAAGIFLTSVYNIFANILIFHKKTTHVMAATVIAAVINVVLNFIMIPRFGYMAAAYNTLLAFVILSIAQYFSMNAVHKRQLFNKSFIVLLSASVIFLCLLCNLLYKYGSIRYGIIMLICILGVMFRNKILALLLRLKKNQAGIA